MIILQSILINNFTKKLSLFSRRIIKSCTFFDLRIPRTKTEIEDNYKRKELLKQFNGKMKQLNTKDLDEMTYK